MRMIQNLEAGVVVIQQNKIKSTPYMCSEWYEETPPRFLLEIFES